MGRGIAMCFANAGIPVRLKDEKREALDSAMRAIQMLYENSVQKGRVPAEEAQSRLSRIRPQIDSAGFETADLIVEAAFENLEIKRMIFGDLGNLAKPVAILATNTSYLNVDEIAERCSCPENVIGLHFFNPANVMRLVEVVPGKATAEHITATALALTAKLGKVAAIAGNCPGFIGNRMLRVYRRQAQFLLAEEASPRQVDSALEEWGMAMGPFAAQDLAGIDIAMSSRHVFAPLERSGFRNPRVIEVLYAQGRLGKKTSAGWYRYDADSKQVDPAVDDLIEQVAHEAGTNRRSISSEEMIGRTIYALINEGARILEEGHASSAADADLVYIHGYGFPPHRGGPMHYADTVGLNAVYRRVLEFRAVHGAN